MDKKYDDNDLLKLLDGVLKMLDRYDTIEAARAKLASAIDAAKRHLPNQ